MGVSHATVGRELEVLKYLYLIRLRAAGGNRQTEWELMDLKQLAKQWGATYNKQKATFELSCQTTDRLRAEVERLRKELQGKIKKMSPPTRENLSFQSAVTTRACVPAGDSRRDANVSPEKHERHAGETQTLSQQIKENIRQENNLSPTPFRSEDLTNCKGVFDEREVSTLLNRAQVLFAAAIENLKDHLVDSGRPRLSHLEDGYENWRRFRFDSLGVIGVSKTNDSFRLTLCASDAALAQAGLEKYRKTWEASMRRWFEREVHIEFQTDICGAKGVGGDISGTSQLLDRWLGTFSLPQNECFCLLNSRKSCTDEYPPRGLKDNVQSVLGGA
jgi:DNA-binding transcriptional ArsR family regulator